MPKYQLSDAVHLFATQTSIITSLWTVYVAATFAAVGYGATASQGTWYTAAVTIGFWLFTSGHLVLIYQALSINMILHGEIKSAIASNTNEDGLQLKFSLSLSRLADTANPPWKSIAIHLLVDLCVTVALWAHVLSRVVA
ncbi:MAG TPA: hypothetical protein VIH87_14815 [Methylocella sp.]